LVGNILIDIEVSREKGDFGEFYIYNNRQKKGTGYEPVSLRLLPLDYKWEQDFKNQKWPTNKLPQVVGGIKSSLFALIKEYLFVSIYKACAESLASENTSRLEAMQRAEKNIDDIENELNNKYHLLRQNSIDEELFDVVSGFEALNKKRKAG
jgi:F-type H+-transporting ATPase subunit gamma